MINPYIFKGWRSRRRMRKFYDQLQNSYPARIIKLAWMLAAMISLHSIAMMVFENMGLGDAVWLSLTSATTVGYGDLSATTLAGRLSTTILIYGIGISVLAQVAAEYVEYRVSLKQKKMNGHWRWDSMEDHILIINTPNSPNGESDLYLERVVGQIRITPELKELPVQILTENYPKTLPQKLVDQGVVHTTGVSESTENLLTANAHKAKYIIVLAKDVNDLVCDSLTLDVLCRLNEINATGFVLVEAVKDDNRSRFINFGADAVIRPIRAYPELAIRGLSHPGTEQVMENLFSHNNDHLSRYDVQFDTIKWKELACKLMMNSCGTPMGYISEKGVITNPDPDQLCSGSGLILLQHEKQSITSEQIAECLK